MRRDELVRAAIGVIHDNGPELTLDELANNLGVSKPVLYAEFGNRVGLADAIAEALARDLELEVAQTLATHPVLDLARLIDVLTDAFITLVDDEAALYEFVVRAFWNDGRGLLGNPLVRILHERLQPIVARTASVSDEELTILIDGVYGFMLASVQSWKSSRSLTRQQVATLLSTVLREAVHGAEESRR
ncbi:MAG: TetR/AcrR family transcriptional regulator [Acidimicrobiales bacterium]|nr:TetR/AcrR family transcriptional regulator [Acidimicrobiales bacterium]